MRKIGSIPGIPTHIYYRVITFTISLMLFTTTVECQNIEVTAVVSPRYIQYNEKATLKLTISGKTEINHIGTPEFNFLPNFLAVPLESRTTPRLIEDKVTVTMAWVYELIPQEIGEIALPDISFLYQGIPYLANPGKVIVGAADTYYNTSTGGVHKVIAEVDNQQPYIHEGIVYRFRYLYTTVLPTVESPTPSLPNFNGFVVEALNGEKNTTAVADGKTFYIQEYVRRLYPQSPGKILIESSELKLPFKRNPKVLKTKPIPLNVQPLPEHGKPRNFSGAVGNFTVKAQVDRNRLTVRQAITLSLDIRGHGNLNRLTPPNISAIPGFQVNSPTQVKAKTGNSLGFTYVVIPRKAGRLQIPAIDFSFYNPATQTYQTTTTQPIPITVLSNSPVVLDSESRFPYWTVLFILLGGVSIVIGFLFYRARLKYRRRSPLTDQSVTHPDPVSVSDDSLAAVTLDMNSPALSEELTRLLHQHLCNKIGEPYRQLSLATVQEICDHVKVSPHIIEEIEEILTKCEYHRFAPVPLSTAERENLVTRLKTVIQSLDAT